jgi:hypothetical protein
VIELLEHETSRDLVQLLPRQLELDDYASTEKISYLPKKLSIKGQPSGYTPKRGDVAYYAPWGNLAIFCHDFSYSPGLVKLGTVKQGFQQLCQTGKYKIELNLNGKKD